MSKIKTDLFVAILTHLIALTTIISCVPSWRANNSPASIRNSLTTSGDTSAPPKVIQGPMLGFVSGNEARVWVRLNGPFLVRAQYGPIENHNSRPNRISSEVQAFAKNDYTAVLHLTNLKPTKKYQYKILFRNKNSLPQKSFSFRTLPQTDKPDFFRIAFGSCVSVDFDSTQEIWTTITNSDPTAFLWIGDNIYGNSSDLNVLREKYRRQRMVKRLLEFQASVPQLAIWDDHDYGQNDGDRRFNGKRNALKAFREYWANPNFGSSTNTPGIFFRWSIGRVQFFFLDSRTYRDPNTQLDGNKKTLLGSAQKLWLMNGLKESKAIFKVLVSSHTWTEWKGPLQDSWSSFKNERDEIFNFIRDENISGVFLIAGDSHRPLINVIPWSRLGGYDFYELISSPLAQRVYKGKLWPGEFQHVRPPNAFRPNFGLLEFDMQASPPHVKLRLLDGKGKDLWKPLKLTSEKLTKKVKLIKQ